MPTKIAVIVALILFGLAVLRTGQLGRPNDRWKAPTHKRPVNPVSVLEETSEYRLIKHPMGETKVPLKPKRIASLCNTATDGLVALGVRPILVESMSKMDGPPIYLADKLRGIPVMPRGRGISLEAVLAARPDLIFASSFQDGKLYGQLSKIAPTIFVGSFTDGYRENRILDVAISLGMKKQSQKLLAEHRLRLKQTKEAIASFSKDQPVSFLRFRKNTCVIYTRTAMFGPLLFEQLGLTPDPAMPMVMSGGGWDVLSVERLSTLEAEQLFIVVDPDSELYLEEMTKTAIWKAIPAVRHHHVHRVASSIWLSGDGLLGCKAIVDDVVKAMLPDRKDYARN